jgi:UDP-N-acetylmuramate dehydrogenase
VVVSAPESRPAAGPPTDPVGAARRRVAEGLGARAVAGAPLGERTTYRTRGVAGLLVVVEDEATLAQVAAVVAETGIELLVVGNGSNLLVADGGFPGLVVALGPAFAAVEPRPEAGLVVAGGAAPLPVLARKSAAAGLRGLEWAVGVPGTVGGAVAMNAGGHGASTGERLVSARLVDLASGLERVVGADGLDLAYRHSNVAASEVVVSAGFAADPGDRAEAEAEIAAIVRWRRQHQPGGRNAGSVFTNPPGDSAGRLIEACGLKGHRVGTAEVSTKHANFIQLDPDGAADDVIELMGHVRSVVAARTGVELASELRIVGVPARPVGRA